jgi:hypothetical protein
VVYGVDNLEHFELQVIGLSLFLLVLLLLVLLLLPLFTGVIKSTTLPSTLFPLPSLYQRQAVEAGSRHRQYSTSGLVAHYLRRRSRRERSSLVYIRYSA